LLKVKGKGLPQQAEVAQGVQSRLRPRIFLTFGTARVVSRQPYVPAAFFFFFIPGIHFSRLSRLQGIWFRRWLRKKSPVTPPGIDPQTVLLTAQCLNHYATPKFAQVRLYSKHYYSERFSAIRIMNFIRSKITSSRAGNVILAL
jgi:hypothetical protein